MNPFEDYISELEILGRKPAYIRGIRSSFNSLIASIGHGDGINPSHITERDIKAWIQDMRKRDLKDVTIKKAVENVERFFAFLIESPDHNDITTNPCKRIYKRLPHGRTQTRRPFKTVEDVGRMIKAAYMPRDRAILTILAKTGIRRSELTGLDVSDVNMDERLLTISKHYDDQARILIPGRKNGVESILPLDDETVKVLKVYLAVRQPVDDALFVSRNGLRLHNSEVGRIVGDYATNAGLMTNGDRITPHYFRAWCTYQLTINGCKPEIVQVIRGDMANTMANFYTREILSFDDVRREYLKAVPVFGI